MFRLLILGGTVFLGRALAEAALDRHHHVTLFNRGRTNPELFPHVEHLPGDRDGALEALRGKRWDAVIDTSGYVPRLVRRSAFALEGAVGHYTFVSSISAYAGVPLAGLDETAPLARLDDPAAEAITPQTYGPLKARSEAAVAAVLPGRTLIVRPGMIVGPNDPSDRFSYWVWRIARGGTVLAPGRPEAPIQLIDVRDLAEWMVRMAESGATGSFNATGPAEPLDFAGMLGHIQRSTGSRVDLVWLNDEFLHGEEVGLDRGTGGENLPFWIPVREAALAGLFALDCRRAIAAGLRYRPLGETITDLAAWLKERPAARPLRAGLSAEREAALLAAWANRKPAKRKRNRG